MELFKIEKTHFDNAASFILQTILILNVNKIICFMWAVPLVCFIQFFYNGRHRSYPSRHSQSN